MQAITYAYTAWMHPRKDESPLVYFGSSEKVESFCCNRDVFCGNYRDERNPAEVEAGELSNTELNGGEPCGALHSRLTVSPDEEKVVHYYIMLLPALAYLIINNYIPMYGITIAFRKLDYKLGILKSPFNGLDNFKFLFASGNLGPILRNTILYNLLFIVVGTIIPITVAILFNEIRCKLAKKFYQTTMLMPYLMSMVIVSYLVFAFLSSDTGFINKSILEPIFGTSISFYQEKKYWPFILTFVHQWKGIGFSMVLYLSALSSISPEYYEAAKLDGATKWQQIRFITLPFLKTMVITMTILSIARICTSDFGLFYQIPKNSGPLYDVTQTIDTYVYNALMNQNCQRQSENVIFRRNRMSFYGGQHAVGMQP